MYGLKKNRKGKVLKKGFKWAKGRKGVAVKAKGPKRKAPKRKAPRRRRR